MEFEALTVEKLQTKNTQYKAGDNYCRRPTIRCESLSPHV